MKTNKLTHLMAIGLALTLVATGCKHRTPPTTIIPGYPTPRVGDGGSGLPPAGTAPVDPTLTGGVPLPNLGEIEKNFNLNRTELAAHTVHFELDSAAVKASERANVEAVAAFMKSAPPNNALLIEGHCDERGTEEYNRSLGERRALALREALIRSGADGNRITTKSYGKDRKIDTGNSEAAHAKNRRGEFVVLTPK